jgi:Putative DNA-binding domain
MTPADLQRLFWRGVRYQPAPSDVLEAFVGDERLSAAGRMDIYRQAYWFRQVGAMNDLLPRTAALIGDGPFAALASRYLRECPSTFWALEEIVRDFPRWLRAQSEAVLSDVAAIEIAKLFAFVANDEASVSAPTVAPEVFLNLVPKLASHLFALPLSAEGIQAYDAALPALQPGGALAVWREHFDVYLRPIEAAEFEALQLAKSGANLAVLCETLALGRPTESAAQAAFHALHAWFSRGWISELI